MKYSIAIMLKSGINDPQGLVVQSALDNLGYNNNSVRVGKVIELESNEPFEKVKEMAEKLLSNPVTEDFGIAVSEV